MLEIASRARTALTRLGSPAAGVCNLSCVTDLPKPAPSLLLLLPPYLTVCSLHLAAIALPDPTMAVGYTDSCACTAAVDLPDASVASS